MAYYSETDDLTYIPFTPEEEREAFRVFYAGEEPAATIARDSIIQRHLKLVAKLAIEAASRAVEDDIAISAGNMALMTALTRKKFDPRRGVLFATYLRLFIRGQVLRAIRAQISFRPEKETLNVWTPEALVTGALAGDGFIPGKPSVVFAVLDEESVDHAYEAQELQEAREKAVAEAVEKLHGLQKTSVQLVSLLGLTYAEVAKRAGVSRQAVEQAHKRALRALRDYLTPLRSELV